MLLFLFLALINSFQRLWKASEARLMISEHLISYTIRNSDELYMQNCAACHIVYWTELFKQKLPVSHLVFPLSSCTAGTSLCSLNYIILIKWLRHISWHFSKQCSYNRNSPVFHNSYILSNGCNELVWIFRKIGWWKSKEKTRCWRERRAKWLI